MVGLDVGSAAGGTSCAQVSREKLKPGVDGDGRSTAADASLTTGAETEEDRVDMAVAVCDEHGLILGLTRFAREILRGAARASGADRIPADLWFALTNVNDGQGIPWSPTSKVRGIYNCARFALDGGRYIVLLQDNSDTQQSLLQRLHKQRLEMTGRLVAMIAHDLRVPLAAIVFNADSAWEEGIEDEDLVMAMQGIRTAAERIRKSIDNLLQFARSGSPAVAAVDLRAVVGRVEALLRPGMRDGDHRFSVSIPDAVATVSGNALVIEQALTNLVLNSMESDTRGVRILVAAERVERGGAPEAMRSGDDGRASIIRLNVSDTGPGVPTALTTRIFEPFFTSKSSGTGLGLPMTREALRAMDGELTLEPSEYGARFALWFPAA
ncbi:MAG: HAMP domain-containing histidine kinase [Myxococcales bacterium]|nr:HAMP domain-containing histidine kinase [Myxococcales bacterium]